MSDLPKGWAGASLGVTTSLRGEKLDPAAVPDAPFIGLEDIEPHTSRILKMGKGSDVKSSVARFSAGDVLYSRLRPYLNKVTIPDFDGIASAEILVLQPTAATEAEFIRRRIMTREFLDFAALLDKGDRPRVNFKEIAEFSIALPPLPEQRRIVAKVDGLTARTARARKELDRIPTLIARYKQRLLALAFSGQLTADWRKENPSFHSEGRTQTGIDGRSTALNEIPAGWHWTSFGEMASVTGGLTKNKSRDNIKNRVPYLRVGNVYANELRLDDVAEIGCTETELAKTLLLTGDLLIVEGNGSIEQLGRVALWNGELSNCSHQNHIIRARPNPDLVPRYGLFWLLSPGGRSAIEGVASSSSGLHTLSITKVKGFPIPVCPLEEQAEIVRRIVSAFGWLDRMAADHAAAARLLPKLDAAILAKAFRGELVPQDPNDEPASLLLERIKAEREAEGKKPKSGRGRKPKGSKEQLMTEKAMPPRDRLLKDSEKWPAVGLPFEAIAMRNSMPHDALRDALFELLSGPSPALQQRFDTDAEVMVIQRVAA